MTITYTTTQRTVKQILEWRETKKLRIPLHQRGFVWDKKRQEGLIDTIRRGLPIPSLTLSKDSSAYWVEDGQQRITTLQRYYTNKLEVDGFFSNSTIENQKNFLDYKLPVMIYENATMEEKIEIFDRLQNGLALSSGERFYSLRLLSPTVMFAIETIFGESTHKLLITQVWGERSLEDGAEKMKDGSSRFNILKQCVCIVGGLVWGPAYFTETYENLREILRNPIELTQKRKANEYLFAILNIYKQTMDTSDKKYRDFCWNPKNMTGFILSSLWETEPSKWPDVQAVWVNFLLSIKKDMCILKEKLHDCKKLKGEAKFIAGCRVVFGISSPLLNLNTTSESVCEEQDDSE